MLGVCDKIVPGPADRRAVVRPPADRLRPRRPDAERPPERREEPHPPAARRRARSAARSCWRPSSAPTTRPAPAPSTGPRTPTSSCSRRWACTCPGASFVNPGTPLRRALTEQAGRVATQGCAPIGEIVDERALVNGVVALLATGGSTNHTMHLVAIAAAAGLQLTWDDFADLSRGRPAAGPRLPQRLRRHQPLPRRGRRAVRDRRAARRRPDAPRRRHRRGLRPRPLPRRAVPRRGRRAALAPRAARESRDEPSCAPVARRRSPPTAASACSTARSAAR